VQEAGKAPHGSHQHHAHGVGHAHGLDRGANLTSLLVALGLNAAYTAGEAIAGALTGSLSLLADAGHNLSDVVALGVAAGAAWLATRPPTPNRTFGFQRAEILAALANAVSLVVIAILIFTAAARRLADPPDVAGGWLIVVAGIGFVVNTVGAAVVFRKGGVDLNLRASFLHLAGDALSSLAVVVAGVVIVATGWFIVDPLVSIGLGVVILASSWSILRDSVLVLLEAAPRGIDVAAIGRRMASHPSVVEVHDLHVWTITSDFPALAAHVIVRPGDDCHQVRRELEHLLGSSFHIDHTTLQVDHRSEAGLLSISPPPRSG
jgi:cobalt-zinc-cadmium efflux system protein